MNVTVKAKPAPTSTTVSTTYKTTTPTTKTTTVKISSSTTTSTTLTSKVTTEPVSEVPDAVPHTNNNEADSAGMTSTVVAILSIIIIVACIGVAGWYYRKVLKQINKIVNILYIALKWEGFCTFWGRNCP